MHLIYIDRNMAKCLYRICMEENIMFLCNLTDFLDRFDRTDLIVCKHNTDQNRIRANRSFYCFR